MDHKRRVLCFHPPVTSAADSLPDDVATLKAMLLAERAARTAVQAEARARALEIEKLRFAIARLRHERFGASSERAAWLIDRLSFNSPIWKRRQRRAKWRRKQRYPRPRSRSVTELHVEPHLVIGNVSAGQASNSSWRKNHLHNQSAAITRRRDPLWIAPLPCS